MPPPTSIHSQYTLLRTLKYLLRNSILAVPLVSISKMSESLQVFEKLQRKNTNRKAVFERLARKDMKCLISVKRLLTVYVATTRKVTVTRYPREYLVMEQVSLAALDLQQRIEQHLLAYDHIREHMENLYALHDYMNLDTPYAASYLAELLRKFVTVIQDVCVRLEIFARQRVTQWDLVVDTLAKQEAVHYPEVSSLIPPLSLLQIITLIGCGGFGTIYKASFGGVAVCTLKVVPTKKFKVSKHACVDKVFASMTNHPFVVKQYSTFQCDQAYLTIMEYVHGIDLSRIVRSDTSPLAETACRLILAQIGLALQHIHLKGFIHRDIKLKLIDFDTAKICCGKYMRKSSRFFDERNQGEFSDRETAGTVPFFSPEVLKGQAYSRALDWWSVGITAFNIAYAKLPWKGDKKDKVFREKVATAPIPHDRLVPLSANFVKLIDDLLIKDPRYRLCSAGLLEFQEHPFFEQMNWMEMMNGSMEVELSEVRKCMQVNPVTGILSPIPNRKKKPALEFENLKDCKEHLNLFTYASAGFQECLTKLLRGQTIERDEWDSDHTVRAAFEVDVMESDDRVYRFKDFTKKISKKKEAIRGIVA